MSDGSSTPYLVVETGSHEGRRINLTGAHLTVGRLPNCDVQFEDPYVSRTHAALWQRAGADYVEDLGSAGGTFVNGEAVTVPRRLYPGDRVRLADLQLRYSAGEGAPQAAVRYDVGEQRAQTINNVARDQYVQHVIQQRESFFREIAATRTRARGLIWIGVVVFVVGLAIAVVGWYQYFGQIVNFSSASMPTMDDFSGFLVFAVGGLVNLVGVLLIIAGIVLHIVATSRRRRVDRDLPPPQMR
ncbi:FHA domain-containing protein [Kribbella rubisoli]|uniref:FHA domain-containing protein n=1 Tax=Kribbella rubisoli TaxID=3075929 RepID=A0A4Q7WM60_9ACTN|nr:FHA domain-containing protein [Kribbella rubisoli]RZU11172.1 FHA domain-containing protein [Kribbella rubisoli]